MICKEYLDELKKLLEITKKNAILEIEKEQMIPAMWSVTRLIDLKAQINIIEEVIEEDKKL